MVTLTQWFLIWFLPNFIYGLLPSTSRSSLNTGFVWHPITKIGWQNGRHLSISAVLGTLTQSFLIGFLPNFIYELLPSSFRSSANTGFVRHTITKMAATYQYPLPWSLSVIFNPISSKFHIWIASINLSFKFEDRFCLTSDNQDGRQNGRHLSISAVVVTLTQSFLIRFLPNFIYEYHPSSFRSSLNMVFVRHPITKMADKMAAAY